MDYGTKVRDCRSLVVLAAFAILVHESGCGTTQQTGVEKSQAISPDLLKLVDSSLLYRREPLPDERNAFVLWQKAVAEQVELPFGDVAVMESYDSTYDGPGPFPGGEVGERLTRWLDSNRPAMNLLTQGILRDRCQLPEVTDIEINRAYLTPFREIGKIKFLNAKRLVKQGNFDTAATELVQLHRFGSMIANGEGVLIDRLVGLAIMRMSFSGMKWLAGQKHVPLWILQSLIASLDINVDTRPGLAQTMRIEFTTYSLRQLSTLSEEDDIETYLDKVFFGALEKQSRDLILKLLAKHPRPFEWAAMVKLSSDSLVEFLKGLQRPWPEAISELEAKADKLRQEVGKLEPLLDFMAHALGEKPLSLSDRELRLERKRLKSVKDPLGKTGELSVIRGYLMCSRAEAGYQSERNALAILLGARLYALRHQKLPSTLQTLVDENIIPAAPIDPFSGKPLHYDHERSIVWSVGKNGVDDGGDGDPNDIIAGKDWVWKIPGVK